MHGIGADNYSLGLGFAGGYFFWYVPLTSWTWAERMTDESSGTLSTSP